jgi:hypothetical protein
MCVTHTQVVETCSKAQQEAASARQQHAALLAVVAAKRKARPRHTIENTNEGDTAADGISVIAHDSSDVCCSTRQEAAQAPQVNQEHKSRAAERRLVLTSPRAVAVATPQLPQSPPPIGEDSNRLRKELESMRRAFAAQTAAMQVLKDELAYERRLRDEDSKGATAHPAPLK